MARPRVLPGQRQRVAEACGFCRGVKKRCSGRAPCSTCIRRGIADSCRIIYRAQERRRTAAEGHTPEACDAGDASEQDMMFGAAAPGLSPETSADMAEPPRQPETRRARQRDRALLSARPSDNSLAPDSASQSWTNRDALWPETPTRHGYEFGVPTRRVRTANRTVEQRASCTGASATMELQPRMLVNLRGERVFVGGSASISFLQLIRNIVSDNIGPTGFSHNETSDCMLEVQPPPNRAGRLETPEIELDTEQRLRDMKAFCASTEGLLDLFLTSELESLIMGPQASDSPCITPEKRATIELVLAIGARCESSDGSKGRAKVYFRHAQQLIFAEMLSNPSVDMVRALVLLAFYLLADCRRNTAFLYLGIAARAAVSLGLHSRVSYLDGSLRYQLRLRIWMSLCVLDMLVSSILGRPAATAGLRFDLDNNTEEISVAANSDMTRYSVASFRVLGIITDSIDKLYERKEISRTAVESLLSRIDSWRTSLPEGLLISPAPVPRGDASLSSHDGSIGKIHVSCLYYYAVALITRPVLISALTALLASQSTRHSPMASACVDASVFMIQTCQEASRAGILLRNMCIIESMAFAAGLVLGFEIFAKHEMDYEVAAAFRGAGDVLSFLAPQSPQAAHYLDILTTLSRAILKQRERITSRIKSGYVVKLLSIDSIKFRDHVGISPSVPRHNAHTSGLAALVQTSTAMQGESSENLAEEAGGVGIRNAGRPEGTTGVDGEVFFGLDSLDLSQWDRFPYLEFQGA